MELRELDEYQDQAAFDVLNTIQQDSRILASTCIFSIYALLFILSNLRPPSKVLTVSLRIFHLTSTLLLSFLFCAALTITIVAVRVPDSLKS